MPSSGPFGSISDYLVYGIKITLLVDVLVDHNGQAQYDSYLRIKIVWENYTILTESIRSFY